MQNKDEKLWIAKMAAAKLEEELNIQFDVEMSKDGNIQLRSKAIMVSDDNPQNEPIEKIKELFGNKLGAKQIKEKAGFQMSEVQITIPFEPLEHIAKGDVSTWLKDKETSKQNEDRRILAEQKKMMEKAYLSREKKADLERIKDSAQELADFLNARTTGYNWKLSETQQGYEVVNVNWEHELKGNAHKPEYHDNALSTDLNTEVKTSLEIRDFEGGGGMTATLGIKNMSAIEQKKKEIEDTLSKHPDKIPITQKLVNLIKYYKNKDDPPLALIQSLQGLLRKIETNPMLDNQSLKKDLKEIQVNHSSPLARIFTTNQLNKGIKDIVTNIDKPPRFKK